jgi:integrase
VSRPKIDQPTYSLSRRGSRYYVQWWQDGAARRVSCRTEIASEAKRFLAEFRAARETPQAPDQPTIRHVLDGYEADRVSKVHSAETLIGCCTVLRRHLGDLPTDMLGDRQVTAYLKARRKEGAQGASATHRKTPRPLSDGTLIRELGTLRAALAWAVNKRWIGFAPHVERPEAPPSRDRWLTRDEADRLLSGAEAPHVRLFIALALYTAARTGALLELCWDQVHLDSGLIVLGRGRGRKRRATVPITEALWAELAPAAEAATGGRVIEHGGKGIQSIKTGFRAAARRAGLPGVTPHVMRHTAATWMVQHGVPLPMVAAYLGNSVEMVERVYGHHSPEWLRQAADALGGSKTRSAGLGNSLDDSGKM